MSAEQDIRRLTGRRTPLPTKRPRRPPPPPPAAAFDSNSNSNRNVDNGNDSRPGKRQRLSRRAKDNTEGSLRRRSPAPASDDSSDGEIVLPPTRANLPDPTPAPVPEVAASPIESRLAFSPLTLAPHPSTRPAPLARLVNKGDRADDATVSSSRAAQAPARVVDGLRSDMIVAIFDHREQDLRRVEAQNQRLMQENASLAGQLKDLAALFAATYDRTFGHQREIAQVLNEAVQAARRRAALARVWVETAAEPARPFFSSGANLAAMMKDGAAQADEGDRWGGVPAPDLNRGVEMGG